jgi:hypothetical protein
MIVNPTQDGWQVIYQPAHALLAAQIASHWRADQRPARWLETLIAIAHHDDEARDWTHSDHLTDSGAPLDFTQSKSPSLVQPRQVMADAHYRGRWDALMISMHMVFLYGYLRGEIPEFTEFIDEQIECQKQWRRELKVTKDEAERAYAIVQWADRMSLILCQGQLPEAERALEVSAGPDGTRHDVMQRRDGTVTVTPWPFEESRFSVVVESRCLSQLSFKDDAELQAVLLAAPAEALTWDYAK